MSDAVLLAIDQGTTGTTILLVDSAGAVVDGADREITQYYPRPGWVSSRRWLRRSGSGGCRGGRLPSGDPFTILDRS